jgi:hypothetical protein
MNTQAQRRHCLYHYTDLCTLAYIVRMGAILPSRAICLDDLVVPALLWLSANRTAELACRAAAELGIDCLEDLDRAAFTEPGRRLARVRVAPSGCVPWLDHPAIRALPDLLALRLHELGVEAGACPDEWWLADGPIPQERWTGIEEWTPEGWTAVVAHRAARTRCHLA